MFHKPVWLLLGWSGILPFVIFMSLSLLLPSSSSWSPEYLFVVYSACILSFLSGSIWLTDSQKHWNSPTLYSNALTLLAFVCVVLNNSWSLALLIAGYASVLAVEFRYDLFAGRPKGYKLMRVGLTSIVIACHGLMLIF